MIVLDSKGVQYLCKMARPKQIVPLTSSALAKFLYCLDPNVSVAEEKYAQIHRRLAKYFELNGCNDPESAADMAIDRAIRKIDEGSGVSNLVGFLYGIARFVLKEHRMSVRRQAPLREDVPAPSDIGSFESEKPLQCLDRCLTSLTPDARDLFLQYYADAGREHLPDRYGTTMNAVRLRVFYTKSKLEACVTACLAS
jgi:DNA-directed RNA polymerase specialized sigma24 family protein